MWPFSKKQKPAIVPPVDLNQPVTNPRLVEAINSLTGTNDKEQIERLLSELNRANFLVATFMDEVVKEPSSQEGTVTFKKGSRIKTLMCMRPDGKGALALFTDWDEIRKFTGEQVSGMVMPAEQAWSFSLAGPGGAVVNPGGAALPLDEKQLQDLTRFGKRGLN